jgi:tRNA A-37 threonylcarbamoyl transferase component Bud32
MTQELLEWDNLGEIIPSGELEGNTRDRLYRFRDSLSVARENGFHILSSSLFETGSPPNKPRNVSVQKAVEEKLLHGGNGLYLSKEYGWLKNNQLDSFDVLRTAKAETSANGVFFGIMANSQTKKGLPIAVKPCEEKPSKAYMDWANNSMVGRQGLKNFSPVGFLVHGDNTFSITELETGIETLDNSSWGNVLKARDDPRYSQQRGLLKKIGTIAGELHSSGIVHNDTQFKNIAVDITGRTFFIDWESATFLPKELDEERRIKWTAHDLSIIAMSAACTEEEKGVGLLSDFSPSLRWEYFRDYVFDPYMETRLEEDEKVFDTVMEIEHKVRDFITNPDKLDRKIKAIRRGIRRALDS